MTQSLEVDSDGDGIVDYTNASAYSYDAKNNRISEVLREDYQPADGNTDRIVTIDAVWDKQRNKVAETFKYDDGADGEIDTITVSKWSYNRRGDLLTYVGETDLSADGIVDSRGFLVNSYGSKPGQVISAIHSGDTNADGNIDNSRHDVFTYDKSGNLKTAKFELDNDANGVIDLIFSYKYEYDRDLRLQQIYQIDSNADGIVDSAVLFEYTYDQRGRLSTEFVMNDSNNDGVIDSTALSSVDYSSRRRLS